MSRSSLVVMLMVLAGLSGCGSSDAQTVKAQFVSAAPLVDGNQVKIDGIPVGTVENMKVRKGHAIVTMNLDPEAMPLHEDATFTIRPASLLGERYIDLERGTESKPELDTSATVPLAQTATNVGLDEVLNTFDDPTGQGLAMLLTTLGTGMKGNGENVDAAIQTLTPSMEQIEQLATVLRNHNTLLGQLVDDSEPIAAALADDDGKSLDKLVDSSDRLLAASAAQQEQLDRTLAKLPGALESARTTLAQLSRTANQTAPTLESLRPVTDKLPEIARELEAFSDALDPALATSQPVLDRADELLREARRPADDLRQASPDLATTVAGARPVVDGLTADRESVFNFIRYWALNTNGFDGLSHYWRISLTLNSDSWTALLDMLGGGGAIPGATTTAPSTSSAKPQDPVGGLLSPLDGLTGGLGTLLGGGGSTDGGTDTGLDTQQESGLLDFLFGGGN